MRALADQGNEIAPKEEPSKTVKDYATALLSDRGIKDDATGSMSTGLARLAIFLAVEDGATKLRQSNQTPAPASLKP